MLLISIARVGISVHGRVVYQQISRAMQFVDAVYRVEFVCVFVSFSIFSSYFCLFYFRHWQDRHIVIEVDERQHFVVW